jgi:hypothetical protein
MPVGSDTVQYDQILELRTTNGTAQFRLQGYEHSKAVQGGGERDGGIKHHFVRRLPGFTPRPSGKD